MARDKLPSDWSWSLNVGDRRVIFKNLKFCLRNIRTRATKNVTYHSSTRRIEIPLKPMYGHGTVLMCSPIKSNRTSLSHRWIGLGLFRSESFWDSSTYRQLFALMGTICLESLLLCIPCFDWQRHCSFFEKGIILHVTNIPLNPMLCSCTVSFCFENKGRSRQTQTRTERESFFSSPFCRSNGRPRDFQTPLFHQKAKTRGLHEKNL